MSADGARFDELEAVAHELERLEGRRDGLALELVDGAGHTLRAVASAANTSPATLHRKLVTLRHLNERKGA